MSKIIYLMNNVNIYKKINGIKVVNPIENKYGFLTKLKKDLINFKKVVILPPNSYDFIKNDEIKENILKSFNLSGLIIKKVRLIDARFIGNIKKVIDKADLIFLTDGYPLEQMNFLNNIDLKKFLKSYKGTLIAVGSGAINSANKVLCAPKDISNINDLKEWEGLGITKINVLPNFIDNEKKLNKESKILRKELIKLSFRKDIIGLLDGSFIKIINGKYKIYGTAYKISKGNVTKILKGEREGNEKKL